MRFIPSLLVIFLFSLLLTLSLRVSADGSAAAAAAAAEAAEKAVMLSPHDQILTKLTALSSELSEFRRSIESAQELESVSEGAIEKGVREVKEAQNEEREQEKAQTEAMQAIKRMVDERLSGVSDELAALKELVRSHSQSQSQSQSQAAPEQIAQILKNQAEILDRLSKSGFSFSLDSLSFDSLTSLFNRFYSISRVFLVRQFDQFKAAAPEYIEKGQKFLREITRELPRYSNQAYAVAASEGPKHWSTAERATQQFLLQNGVPQQYAQAVAMGIVATVSITVLYITIKIVFAFLACLCCCGKRKKAAPKRK